MSDFKERNEHFSRAMTDAQVSYIEAERAACDLEAENAKLRELCERMHRHIRQTCGECDGWYCSNFDEDNECCVYDTLVRELGVEVTP